MQTAVTADARMFKQNMIRILKLSPSLICPTDPDKTVDFQGSALHAFKFVVGQSVNDGQDPASYIHGIFQDAIQAYEKMSADWR